MAKFLKRQKAAIALLLVGCLFVALGVARDEHKTVARKSNIICMECIGIG